MKKYLFSILIIIATLSVKAQSLSGKHHIKYLEINTVQSDYGTTFLEEDKVIFTTPADDKNKNSQLDLFVGDIGDEGEIVNKERVKGFIGSKISKTGITYSQDKKTVYFSAIPYRKRPRKKDRSQLFSAKVEESGQWTEVTKLDFNHKNYSIENPSLSKDGKKLYFVSDMPSSIGGKDIYTVTVGDNGTFGPPVNLGPKVNTTGDEVTPYITDGNILYFSSNGHKEGVGSLDVYASEVFENTVSDPLHLDSPVNSMNDDFAYIVNAKNDRGFFSSNRLQGQSNNDIYAFTIEEDKPEKCLQEITGIVRDKITNEVLRDAAITLFDNDGNQVQQVVTDTNGSYRLSLDCSNTFTLVAASLHYNKEEHVVNTANYMNAPTLEADKYLVRKADEAAVTVVEEVPEDAATLNSIYFDFDRSDIRVDATSELDKIVDIMKENSSIRVEVSAFTDARGASAYNLLLSNRRAKSTIDYIVSKGIKRSRLTGKGHGESRMLNKCVNGVECSEEAHAINRRTEFAILNTQSARTPSKQKPSSLKERAAQVEKQVVAKKTTVDLNDKAPPSIDHQSLDDKMANETENELVTQLDKKATDTALLNEEPVNKSSEVSESLKQEGIYFSDEAVNDDSTTDQDEGLKSTKTALAESPAKEVDKVAEIKIDQVLEDDFENLEGPVSSELNPATNTDKQPYATLTNEPANTDNLEEIVQPAMVEELAITNNKSAQVNPEEAIKKKTPDQGIIGGSTSSVIEPEEEIKEDSNFNFGRDLSNTEEYSNPFLNKEDVSNAEIDDATGLIEPKEKKIIIPAIIEKNLPIKTSTVNVSAMSIKGNGNYIETARASKTDAIKVEFKMFNNREIAPGNKEIFIVIENPTKKVINERGTFTLRTGEVIAYSDETVAYYDNNGLYISILSDRFIQRIVKGTYVVKIYIERYLTGQTFLILS